MTELNQALSKAHEALEKKRAEGGLGGNLRVSAADKDLFITAAQRTDLKLLNEDGKESSSWRVYVMTVVKAAAVIDAAKLPKPKKVKTLAEIQVEIEALQARAAKMVAEAAGQS